MTFSDLSPRIKHSLKGLSDQLLYTTWSRLPALCTQFIYPPTSPFQISLLLHTAAVTSFPNLSFLSCPIIISSHAYIHLSIHPVWTPHTPLPSSLFRTNPRQSLFTFPWMKQGRKFSHIPLPHSVLRTVGCVEVHCQQSAFFVRWHAISTLLTQTRSDIWTQISWRNAPPCPPPTSRRIMPVCTIHASRTPRLLPGWFPSPFYEAYLHIAYSPGLCRVDMGSFFLFIREEKV